MTLVDTLFEDVPVLTQFTMQDDTNGALYMKCKTFLLEDGEFLNAVGLDDGDFYEIGLRRAIIVQEHDEFRGIF